MERIEFRVFTLLNRSERDTTGARQPRSEKKHIGPPVVKMPSSPGNAFLSGTV